MKICGHCQKELPKNTDWFDRDQSKEDGFKNWCKACRKERRELARLQEAASIIDTLDKVVVANLANARPGGSDTPHQLEFFQYATMILGGVQGAVQFWAANMIAAKPGSQTRERAMGQYLKLMESCSGDGKVSPPPELMSEEDLKAAIARDEERMRRNEQWMKDNPPFNGNVIDAE
jgi:hypothetical protein